MRSERPSVGFKESCELGAQPFEAQGRPCCGLNEHQGRSHQKLPEEFQAKLNLARGGCGGGDDAGGWRRTSGCCGVHHGIGRVEIRVIEDVEKFRSELQVKALGQRPSLRERKIKLRKGWTLQDVAANISVGSRPAAG